jgi:hypothetical protein
MRARGPGGQSLAEGTVCARLYRGCPSSNRATEFMHAITANYHAQSMVSVRPRMMERLRKICLNPPRLPTSTAPEREAACGLEG